MNIKLNKIDIDSLDYGVPFIAKTNDDDGIEFIAMKIHNVDECGEAILDLESSVYYGDIHNYKVVKIINGTFVEK